jgi:hypothetical protein
MHRPEASLALRDIEPLMQSIQHASRHTSSGTPLVVMRETLHLCKYGFVLHIIPHFLYISDVR